MSDVPLSTQLRVAGYALRRNGTNLHRRHINLYDAIVESLATYKAIQKVQISRTEVREAFVATRCGSDKSRRSSPNIESTVTSIPPWEETTKRKVITLYFQVCVKPKASGDDYYMFTEANGTWLLMMMSPAFVESKGPVHWNRVLHDLFRWRHLKALRAKISLFGIFEEDSDDTSDEEASGRDGDEGQGDYKVHNEDVGQGEQEEQVQEVGHVEDDSHLEDEREGGEDRQSDERIAG